MPDVYFLNIPNLAPLELATGPRTDPLTYRKEIIYVGDFTKQQDNLKFSVNQDVLEHWHNTTSAMLANGVEIPIPAKHTEDSDAKRGTLVGTEIAKNAKGLPALFGFIKFVDDAAAKSGKNNDVSLYSPSEFVDGKGNKYYRPIRHVALTDYPVIPGLGKFEAIAASLAAPSQPPPIVKKGDSEMSIDVKKLGAKLGIPMDTADDKLELALSTAIDALIAKAAKAHGGEKPPIAAGFLSLAATNRKSALKSLVEKSKISPAVCKTLEDAFVTNDHLALSLSLDSAGALQYSDGFDAWVTALSGNEVVPLKKEQTGPQIGNDGKPVVLSQGTNPDTDTNNPLTRNAEAKANASKK
jgi:hypothetical protein